MMGLFETQEVRHASGYERRPMYMVWSKEGKGAYYSPAEEDPETLSGGGHESYECIAAPDDCYRADDFVLQVGGRRRHGRRWW